MASSSSNTGCAACQFYRRECTPGCVFPPYFLADNPQLRSSYVELLPVFGKRRLELQTQIAINKKKLATNGIDSPGGTVILPNQQGTGTAVRGNNINNAAFEFLEPQQLAAEER